MKDGARMADALSKVDAMQVRGGWVDTMRQTLHAGLLALEGRPEEAAQRYVATARRWRELETWFELALSQFDFAATIGNNPDAKAAADEAHQIFTRLGAKPMLQRLEKMGTRLAERVDSASLDGTAGRQPTSTSPAIGDG
jgi:hypothetical protein